MAGADGGGPTKTANNVVGASVGTGIAAVAQLIPEDYKAARAAISIAAPVVAVVGAIVWAWFSKWLDRTLKRIDANDALKKARRVRDRVLKDPHATVAHKRRVQQNVEEFEELILEQLKGDLSAADRIRPASGAVSAKPEPAARRG